MDTLFNKKNHLNRLRTPGVRRSAPQGCAWVVLIVLGLMSAVMPSYAAEPEKKEDAFRMKTMEGEIAGKTRYNLSVVYKKDGDNLYEAVIPLDREKIKLKRYKSFQEIQDGDMIRVEFKEFYKVNDQGEEVRTGRLATAVELVKNSVSGKLISKD